ncbi:hypothetical protein WJX81_003896 [Elliptochloris bilobata]|uniref:RRM Nup35-type domain-containing protein n=1 Tax=Elliptochloris bilobata TaxID=381761 RepID=A0AAW1QVB8_9CHLO
MTTPSKEFSALLFTPRTGDRASGPSYRSPARASARADGGYGRASSYREGLTPRRRSLTPTGSGKEAPMPAPPQLSLLEDEASAAPERAVALQPSGHQPAEEESQDECFVTVFGFLPEAHAAVMREFARCGEILAFGSGREDKVNWVHIQYANKYQAQRALQRNGMVSGHTMVGVRPLDRRFRGEALALTAAEPAPPLPRSVAPPLRPYRVDAATAQAPLPQRSRSAWALASELILGL